jgi:hypothetical protein
MPHVPWIVAVLIAFAIGAWAVGRWPSVNVIGKITGS